MCENSNSLPRLTAEIAMKDFKVRVGAFYVNENKGLVREITHEDWDGNVHWRGYNLSDGKATGDSVKCSLSRIVQWADREATAEEAVRMDRAGAETRELSRVLKWAESVLESVPDQLLFAEVRRRGHQVI
jgi:hypothetical protein